MEEQQPGKEVQEVEMSDGVDFTETKSSDNDNSIVDDEADSKTQETKAHTSERKEPFLDKVLKSREFNALMVILTLYALFGDDVRLAFYDVDSDQVFFTLSILAMIMFLIEMALQFYFRLEYRWGFYFVLDVLSTASMLPDTNLLTELIVDAGEGGGDTATSSMKAGKTSRAGAKAGRVVKIVRLIRFVRIFKILKVRKQNSDDMETTDEGKTLEDKLEEEPSKVGKKLTELTVRRVIVIVLAMIMVFPFLDEPEVFLGEPEFTTYEVMKLNDLHMMTDVFNVTGNVTQAFFKEQVKKYALQEDIKDIVFMKLNNWDIQTTNSWISEVTDRHVLLNETQKIQLDLVMEYKASNVNCKETPYICFRRSDARCPVTKVIQVCANSDNSNDEDECGSVVYYNLKDQNKFSAKMSLLKTSVIVVGLALAVILFSRDAETLVIDPIERMIKLVKRLADNPLANLYRNDEDVDAAEGFETTLLETTLEKISSLLQVGFGVAGAQIIQCNMSSGGDLDVMIPGRKITAIFGFGIMEEFTNTCSCLEEEMCTYINTIAKIIHDNSIAYHGAPNKNIGSAFLLVWKICDGVLPGLRDLRDENGVEMHPKKKAKIRTNIGCMSAGLGTKERKLRPQELVDSALVGVLKMRLDLNLANRREGALAKFKKNRKLVEFYGDGKFEVKMGFGLHIGWAIEGAIGSNYKIDASYLSPNVNMAARLEAATHQFGTPLLVSGPFINELSSDAQKLCRKIDVVTVKGSQIPLELWTCDISNYDYEAFDAVAPVVENGEQQAVDIIKVKSGVQRDFSAVFKHNFEQGVDQYIRGDWNAAKVMIEKALSIYKDDGPSNSLFRVMSRNNFKAPDNWRGFRELTSK